MDLRDKKANKSYYPTLINSWVEPFLDDAYWANYMGMNKRAYAELSTLILYLGLDDRNKGDDDDGESIQIQEKATTND